MRKSKRTSPAAELALSMHLLARLGTPARRLQAQLALVMGVLTLAASLGILTGQILRAAGL